MRSKTVLRTIPNHKVLAQLSLVLWRYRSKRAGYKSDISCLDLLIYASTAILVFCYELPTTPSLICYLALPTSMFVVWKMYSSKRALCRSDVLCPDLLLHASTSIHVFYYNPNPMTNSPPPSPTHPSTHTEVCCLCGHACSVHTDNRLRERTVHEGYKSESLV